MDPMSQNPPMLLQLTCPAFYDDGQNVPWVLMADTRAPAKPCTSQDVLLCIQQKLR